MAEFGGSRFRESAIVRSAHLEPLDERAQLTAPREWAVLACLGLVLVAIVVWGAFGSVERTLRSDAVLVSVRRTAHGSVGVPRHGRRSIGQRGRSGGRGPADPPSRSVHTGAAERVVRRGRPRAGRHGGERHRRRCEAAAGVGQGPAGGSCIAPEAHRAPKSGRWGSPRPFSPLPATQSPGVARSPSS